MRESQWFVLGIAFLLLMNWFIYLDFSAEKSCGTPLTGFNGEGGEPLQNYRLWCINTEIYNPFIYLFGILGITCFINCGLEWWGKRRK